MNLLKFAFFIFLSLKFGFYALGQCPVSSSCTPGDATDTFVDAGIIRFRLENIDNTSGDNDQGYEDFSCSDSTSLIIGKNYSFTVNFVGTNLDEAIRIWADMDGNGTFDAVNELLYENATGASSHTGTINIPNGTLTDSVLRLRVASEWDGYTMPTPCSTPKYGQTEDYSIIVRDNPYPPEAIFSVDDSVTCDGTVKFTDESNNVPTQWFWDFGDGNTSNIPNPTHSYADTGIYTVTFVAINANGKDTLTKTGFIQYLNEAPVDASCIPSTLSYCCGYGILGVNILTISKTSGNASEGSMDFTCGQSASLKEGTEYNLNLTLPNLNQMVKIYLDKDEDGLFDGSGELLDSISVSGSKSVPFTVSPGANKGVPLRLRVCVDSEGSEFDACGPLTSGQCEDYTVYISKNTNPPVADFTVDDADKCDSIFQFQQLVLNNLDSLIWDFGDSTYSSEFNPQHTYSQEGSYTVSLKAFNEYGSDSVVKTNYITVNFPATASCSVTSGAPDWANVGIKNVNFATIFNNTSSDPSKSYKDYSCEHVANVIPGETYFFLVNTGTQEDEDLYIFIDYNNNGILDDFGELVFNDRERYEHNGQIKIPEPDGEVEMVYGTKLRMRIMSQGNLGPGGDPITGPCSDVMGGEVEDYGVVISDPNGVSDEFSPIEFVMYPNPTNGLVHLELEEKGNYDIVVFNMLGESVFNQQNMKDRNVTLRLNERPGLYYLQLSDGQRRVVEKLIIR